MKRLRWVAAVFAAVLVIAWFVLPRMVENRSNRVLHAVPYRASAAAEALHKRLLITDFHADSLFWGRNLLRRSTVGHVDLPRLVEGNVAIQAFTVVTRGPRHLNINQNSDSSDLVRYWAIADAWPPRTWNSPKQRALYQARRLYEFETRAKGGLVIIQSRSDLQKYLANRSSGR